METLNCMKCKYRHEDNGNCTAVGGFCTAVPAAHCPLLRDFLDTGLTPDEIRNMSGERAPRCPAVIAQAGYTGQNHFSVTYGDQKVTVRAEDGYAALFTAAKHWGYKFTRPEYHQNARATKLHYTPDTRPGALV